jgi:predicted nucleic acid-binding protein
VFSFTSVTVYEIVYGLEVKSATAQLQRVLPWLRQNDGILPSVEDDRAAASTRAKATRQGAPLELTDCLVAAVAGRMGRPLVTGNTDDFRAIQKTGVKLVIDNWREFVQPADEIPGGLPPHEAAFRDSLKRRSASDGKQSRLGTMPRGGECSRQAQRRMGIPRNTDAGFGGF